MDLSGIKECLCCCTNCWIDVERVEPDFEVCCCACIEDRIKQRKEAKEYKKLKEEEKEERSYLDWSINRKKKLEQNICPECGSQVDPGYNSCSFCGYDLRK